MHGTAGRDLEGRDMSPDAQPARGALELFKDHPVTMTCCALWIIVFIAMIVRQGGLQGGMNPLANGISPQISHVFGDQTPRDIRAGQLWRTLTQPLFITASSIFFLT
jgi:hypothetical protein